MDEALAAEAHHLGLGVAPIAQRPGPLLRPAELERLLAALDRPAVDDPGDDRRELVRCRGDHRLVEEAQALGATSGHHEHVTALMGGEGEQIHVAVFRADIRDSAESFGRGLEIALAHLLEGEGNHQVAVLDRVGRLVLDQALPAAKPAARGAHLAATGAVEADPDRAASGEHRIALGQVRLVLALHRGEVLVLVAEHVGRSCQQPQVVGSQPGFAIGCRKALVGVRPPKARVRLSAPIELGHARDCRLRLRRATWRDFQHISRCDERPRQVTSDRVGLFS